MNLTNIIREEIENLSLDNIREYLINYFNLNNVVEPATIPIKDGNVRLFHQTNKENFERIIKDGSINIEKSRGALVSEPIAVWGDKTGFYGSPREKYTIEYQVPKEDVDGGRVFRSIRPDEIIAFHNPVLFKIKEYTLEDDRLKMVVNNPKFYLSFENPESDISIFAAYLMAKAILEKK